MIDPQLRISDIRSVYYPFSFYLQINYSPQLVSSDFDILNLRFVLICPYNDVGVSAVIKTVCTKIKPLLGAIIR